MIPSGAARVRPERPPRTQLADLADAIGARTVGDPTGVVITGLTLSSQRVAAGDLYAALPGTRAHGASYAAGAVGSGAVAVLTDRDGADRLSGLAVPVLVVDDPRSLLGRLAARVYDEPARRLDLIAVTGTQGKTTTTRLLEAALTGSGVRTAVVGTVGTRIAGVEVKTELTTPESPDLHALFAAMNEADVAVCAMEVSSHALVMGRVDGVVFDVAVFTNLGRDHLDFHATLEDYFLAKADLFTTQRSRLGLTNVDDEHGRRLLEVATVPMRTFSTQGAEADWRATDIEEAGTGSAFVVHGPGREPFATRVPLPGRFNVANALAAIAAVAEAGLDPVPMATTMGTGTGVPGRLERVDAGQDFQAFVDYAHKPDAVTAAIEALRPMTTGRMIVVIGAGGDRDRGKRPLMGRIAAELADLVVITDDNPRSEDPARIRGEVIAGAGEVAADRRAEIVEIGDRRAAIREAVRRARAGDCLLVAGKGHETGQEVGGVVHPFDDRVEVRAAIEERSR